MFTFNIFYSETKQKRNVYWKKTEPFWQMMLFWLDDIWRWQQMLIKAISDWSNELQRSIVRKYKNRVQAAASAVEEGIACRSIS